MRIVVFGSKGMAGHIVAKYLKEQNYEVITIAKSDADINSDIEKDDIDWLPDLKADFVVNCIGLLVKDSNIRPDRAIYLNSYFPHKLEKLLNNTNTRLIHLSTDCVFDGLKGYYVESDLPTECNWYGKSKALGEISNTKDITFRTSIIGHELKNGTGLLNWILNSPDTIEGWNNVLWNGITTLKLAECINQHIQNPIMNGIYHLVNNEVYTNKYELLCLINDIYKLGKTIVNSKGPKDINKILVNTRYNHFMIQNYASQISSMKQYHDRTTQEF
jgi:dTDP-4-dehydrorhamnose reductase